MTKCDSCGKDVDERTISAHGMCIPCMDRAVDEVDAWTGPVIELADEMKSYGTEIIAINERQKVIRKLLREVRGVLTDQSVPRIRSEGYLQTCDYCGKRFRGLKMHQRYCPKAQR